jgi:hypothetical protein
VSEYWDIGCKTCAVEAGAFHANHGADRIAVFVPLLPAIAQLGEIDVQVKASWAEWMAWSALIMFAKVHAGHDVKPRSEYGYFLGEPKPWGR